MKRLFTAALATLTLLVPTIAQADTWTQYGHDAAYSRVNAQQAPLDASRWRLRWSKSKATTTNPIIVDGAIIVAGTKVGADHLTKTYVWAFDYQGHKLWTRQVGIGWPSESISYIDGLIVVGVANMRDDDLDRATPELEFIDVETGAKVQSLAGWGGSAPVADENYMYYPHEGTVRHELPTLLALSTQWTGSGVYDERLFGPPTIVDGQRWVGSGPFDNPNPIVGGGVAMVWEGSANSYDVATGALTRTLACDTTPNYGLCAVDIATGQTLWTSPGWPVTPTIVGDVVFMQCDDTSAICRRNLRTGAVLTKTADLTHGSNGTVWPGDVVGMAGPAVGGGAIFVNQWDGSLGKWVTAGIDVSTGDLLTRRRGLYGPVGGWHTAVADGLLVSTVPGLRVVSFDRA